MENNVKKIVFILCLFLILFSNFSYADTNEFNREKIIIEGLSKKQLKDRLQFLEMAKFSNSNAVFEKLTQMYKVNNSIKDDVFNAMEWQNINNNGKFSEKFAEAMLEEYNQLKKAKQENKVAECPQLDYLDLCIATCLDKHYPGFDNFIKYIMHNIDNLLEETWDYHYDPIKLKNTILANCIFYFALRNEAGYIEKLADVTQKGDILEIGTILNFFKEQKNDGIFDFLSKELENDYKNDLLIPSLLDSYFEYAKILNKKIPIILQEAKSRIDAKYSEQAKEILKGSKRFDEKFFKENNN